MESGLEQRVDFLTSGFGELKADVGVLKVDVAVLKKDVGELKTDVAVLKTDVAYLKRDVSELRGEVHVVRAHQERAFRVLFRAIIALGIGMSALVAKGFGWVH